MAKSITVQVLMVEHRHGTNTSVHRTEEAARDELHGYVVMWWEQEMEDQVMPEDRDEAIKAYFEAQEGEFYKIVESSLDGAAVIAEDSLLGKYQKLHAGLVDMVNNGRLKPADVPNDFRWLVDSLTGLANHPENT